MLNTNYIDVSLISTRRFTELLLADLASKDLKSELNGSNTRTAIIPKDYKNIFETIIYGMDSGMDFTKIFDLRIYLSTQEYWEESFDKALNSIIDNSDKVLKEDINSDNYEIEYTLDEIKKIKAQYNSDKDILELMDRFSDLFIIVGEEKYPKYIKK